MSRHTVYGRLYNGEVVMVTVESKIIDTNNLDSIIND